MATKITALILTIFLLGCAGRSPHIPNPSAEAEIRVEEYNKVVSMLADHLPLHSEVEIRLAKAIKDYHKAQTILDVSKDPNVRHIELIRLRNEIEKARKAWWEATNKTHSLEKRLNEALKNLPKP